MPVGYICDDGLIETLAKWDLDPANKPDKSRVVGCADAAYHVHRWKDVRLYARRLRRYSLRHFQDRMLLHVLRTEGLAAVPAHVNDLYCRHHRMCRVRWRGYHTVFDYWALRRIRASASSEPSVSSHGPEDQPLAQ
jgi:hypothetical protein